jgi:hypothetical protein
VTPPTCTYCERPFSSPNGCDYLADDEKPLTYGSELHPLSEGATCRDCGTPKGREHHVECLCTECPTCHRQWHPGMSCREDAELTTGAAA